MMMLPLSVRKHCTISLAGESGRPDGMPLGGSRGIFVRISSALTADTANAKMVSNKKKFFIKRGFCSA